MCSKVNSPCPKRSWTVRYHVVLSRVYQTERWADSIAARGKNPEAVRARIKREAGLTDEEERALKQAAAEYCPKHEKFLRDRSDVVKDRPKDDNEQKGKSAQVKALEKQDRQNLLEIIEKLKQTFGTARWEAFDAFNKANLANNIKVGAPQKEEVK